MGEVIQLRPSNSPSAGLTDASSCRAREGLRDEIGRTIEAARAGELKTLDPETEAFWSAMARGDDAAAAGILKNVRLRLGFAAVLRVMNREKL